MIGKEPKAQPAGAHDSASLASKPVNSVGKEQRDLVTVSAA